MDEAELVVLAEPHLDRQVLRTSGGPCCPSFLDLAVRRADHEELRRPLLDGATESGRPPREPAARASPAAAARPGGRARARRSARSRPRCRTRRHRPCPGAPSAAAGTQTSAVSDVEAFRSCGGSVRPPVGVQLQGRAVEGQGDGARPLAQEVGPHHLRRLRRAAPPSPRARCRPWPGGGGGSPTPRRGRARALSVEGAGHDPMRQRGPGRNRSSPSRAGPAIGRRPAVHRSSTAATGPLTASSTG